MVGSWSPHQVRRHLRHGSRLEVTRFVERANHTPDLFQGTVADVMAADDSRLHRLDQAIDKLRSRYGRQVVYCCSVQESRDDAPMRISFTHIPDLEVEKD